MAVGIWSRVFFKESFSFLFFLLKNNLGLGDQNQKTQNWPQKFFGAFGAGGVLKDAQLAFFGQFYIFDPF